MAVLPSSGPLSINDIAGVMGGSAPHSLSEYYLGGGLVPSTKTVTVREPTSGEFYTLGTYAFNDIGTASTAVYWGGLIASGLPSGTSSYSSGGYTYYRGSYQETTGGGYVPFDYWYGIYRTSESTVPINTTVPTSGVISISNFYGAEKP